MSDMRVVVAREPEYAIHGLSRAEIILLAHLLGKTTTQYVRTLGIPADTGNKLYRILRDFASPP